MNETGYPEKQGLYDPQYEHDACGFGFVADIKGRASHDILSKALQVLVNLEHRGAVGAEKNTGDGAGILFQTPHAFLDHDRAPPSRVQLVECEPSGKLEPPPVIVNGQPPAIVIRAEAEHDVACAAVLPHVDERLLRDPKDLACGARSNLDVVEIAHERRDDAGVPAETIGG